MEHDKLLDEAPVVHSISPMEGDIGLSIEPPSPPWPILDLDFDIEHRGWELPSAVVANDKATSSAGSGSVVSGSQKKVHHNAYERDRRKKLNEMYSSLSSLLPDPDHTKKLSFPSTVCQVIEYIPKLKKQVENLEKKKEELTRAKSMKDRTTPIVSATPLNDKEIMVQVSLLNNMDESLPLSKCIQVLEKEGLQLISSSTFSNFEIHRTFYSLHLQKIQGVMNKECPALLSEKLEKAVKEKSSPCLQK